MVVVKRNRTEDILKIVEKDWKSTNYLTKKAERMDIYKHLNSVKRHLEILLKENKVERKNEDYNGKVFLWKLKSEYISEPNFGELK